MITIEMTSNIANTFRSRIIYQWFSIARFKMKQIEAIQMMHTLVSHLTKFDEVRVGILFSGANNFLKTLYLAVAVDVSAVASYSTFGRSVC